MCNGYAILVLPEIGVAQIDQGGKHIGFNGKNHLVLPDFVLDHSQLAVANCKAVMCIEKILLSFQCLFVLNYLAWIYGRIAKVLLE